MTRRCGCTPDSCGCSPTRSAPAPGSTPTSAAPPLAPDSRADLRRTAGRYAPHESIRIGPAVRRHLEGADGVRRARPARRRGAGRPERRRQALHHDRLRADQLGLQGLRRQDPRCTRRQGRDLDAAWRRRTREVSYKGDVKLPNDVKAVVVSPSIVGDRFIQLAPAYDGGAVLKDHAYLPSTAPRCRSSSTRSISPSTTSRSPSAQKVPTRRARSASSSTARPSSSMARAPSSTRRSTTSASSARRCPTTRTSCSAACGRSRSS